MLMDYVYRIGNRIFGVYQTDTADFAQFFKGQATTLGVDAIYAVRVDGEHYIWDKDFGWMNCKKLRYLKPEHFVKLDEVIRCKPLQ